jgi:hypothetical protein
MERRIPKTMLSADGERRLQIYQRGDGLFSFTEDKKTEGFDGEPCWTPVWPSRTPICDSAETAEREALAWTQINWLQNPN